jgi:hypothetical protein
MELMLTHYDIGTLCKKQRGGSFPASLQSLIVTPNWHLLLILQQVLILQVFPDPSFWG